MKLSGLQIHQNQICSHGIFNQQCWSCQIQTLILCQKEMKRQLPKDLNHLLFSIIKGTKKVFSFSFRFSADCEVFYHPQDGGPDSGYYQGLVPLSQKYEENALGKWFRFKPPTKTSERPPQDFQFLKKLRIVFVGEKEEYYGFFWGLWRKYGSRAMARPWRSDETTEIHKRCHWGKDLDTISCLFRKRKKAIGYIRISDNLSDPDDEFAYYFTSLDTDKAFAGYRKMLELDIPEVHSRARTTGKLVYKCFGHKRTCGLCNPRFQSESESDSGSDSEPEPEPEPENSEGDEDYDPHGGILTELFSWSKEDPKVEECDAYWYYLE